VLAAAVYAARRFVLGTGYVLSTTTDGRVPLGRSVALCLVRWARTVTTGLLGWLGVVTAVALQSRVPDPVFWAVLRGGTCSPSDPASWPPGPGCGWPAGAPCSPRPRARLAGPHGWRGPLAPDDPTRPAACGPTTFPCRLLLLGAGLFRRRGGRLLRGSAAVVLRRAAPLRIPGWTAIGVFAVFLALGCRPTCGRRCPGAVGGGRRGGGPAPAARRNLAGGWPSWPGLADVRAAPTARRARSVPAGRAWPSSPLTRTGRGSAGTGGIGGHRGSTPESGALGTHDAGWLLSHETVPRPIGAGHRGGVPAERPGDRSPGHVGRRRPGTLAPSAPGNLPPVY